MSQNYQSNPKRDSDGVVDTIRFIQHFSPGEGNYTAERHQWLEQKSLDDVLGDIEQLDKDDLNRYQEVIE
jgi:hypothetical protein